MKFNIFCDFDGVITTDDATNAVLEAFASPEYRDWYGLRERGLVTARECIERQARLIRARPESLRLVAASLAIDSGIYEIERGCEITGASLVIISDGFDVVMDAVLKARRLAHLRHYSNKLCYQDARSLSVRFPFADAACQAGCGVCKCKIVNEKSRDVPAVYIGDGVSNRCVAGRAERLFAKGGLREYCLQNRVNHEPFADLSEVAQALFGSTWIREPQKNRIAGHS